MKYTILTYCFCLLAAITSAQQKSKTITLKHADVLKYDKSLGINAKRLIGKVECEHDGSIMRCDSAYLYDDKKLEAFSHISIVRGDSLFVYGDKLYYDANTKLASLEKNVKCIEKDMTLTTNLMTFDVANSVASYYNGGTIVNKENTLTSKNGHYYSNAKELAFHYDVVLVNPDYTIKGDTLRYNTTTRTTFFLGPSIIQSKENYIYCENGWYNTQNETARFSKNALIITKEQKLTGDSLYYDRLKGYGKAIKNVRLIDTTNKSVITGDLAEYYEKQKKSLVTQHPMYTQLIEADSLFITADTLFYHTVDSTQTLLKAYHHVKIYKSDMQGVCDSLNYTTKDSLMEMNHSPIFWSKNMQAFAKQINVYVGRHSIQKFELLTNAFLIEQADSINKYNQVSGKDIDGFFVRDSLRKINVNGNAQVYYYVKNKNKFSGLNHTICSDITILLNKDGLEKMSFKTKPESKITPMKDVNPEESLLKGFNWYEDRRPISKLDIIQHQ